MGSKSAGPAQGGTDPTTGGRAERTEPGVQPEVDLGEPVVGYNAVVNAPEHRAERKPGGGRKEANRFPRENEEEIR